MPDDIVVKLVVDDSEGIEQTKAFYQAAVAAGQGYSAVVEKVDRKIYELTRTQQVLTAAIQETAARITDYQAKAQGASEAEQAGLEAAIKKEQALAAGHQQVISVIESKIVALNAQKDVAQAASDSERLGIQLVAQQRLIEIQTIRDTTQALISKDIATEAAVARTQAALDAQIAKQALLVSSMTEGVSEVVAAQGRQQTAIDASKQRIASLQAQSTSANDIQKAGIEAQIEKEQRLIEAHQAEVAKLEQKRVLLQGELEAAKATSDTEKAGIAQITQARLADLLVLKDTAEAQKAGAKAVKDEADSQLQALDDESAKREKLNAQYDEQVAKQRVHLAVIDADQEKIGQLESKKTSASEKEKAQIDEEIASLRKTITVREQEILTIETKKVKLQEMLDKQLATSDAEIQAAEKAAAQRLIEINMSKDQLAAQNAVNDSIDEGSEVANKFFSRMTGFGAVIIAATQMVQVFKAGTEQLEKEIEAVQKLRDLNAGVAGSIEPAYQAYNLPEQTINQVVLDTMKQTGVEQDKVVSTLSEYAPYLNNQNISPNSQQGRGLIAAGAMYAKQGLSADASAFLLQDSLQQNGAITGDQFNQRVADIRSDFKSPKQAEEMLQVFRENADKFQSGGFNLDDMVRIGATISQQVNPAAYSRVIRQIGQSVIKNEGKTPEQQLKDFEAFAGLTPLQEEQLNAAKYGSFAQRLKGVEGMLSPNSPLKSLAPLYEAAIGGGKALDEKAVLTTTESLPPNLRDIVNRTIAGPRDVEAGDWSSYFSATPIASGTGTPLGPFSGARTQQTEKDIADLTAVMGNPATPGGTLFDEATKQAGSIYAANIGDVPDMYKGAVGSINRGLQGATSFGTTVASDAERDAAEAYALKFMEMVRLREQIDSGKLKASAGDRQRVQSIIDSLLDRLEIGIDKDNPMEASAFSAFQALASGTSNTKNIASDGSFIAKNLRQDVIGTHGSLIADPTVGTELFRQAQDAQRHILQGSPVPSTQPTQGKTPVSMNNYYQRINYFGTAHDQIGAPNDYDSRMS